MGFRLLAKPTLPQLARRRATPPAQRSPCWGHELLKFQLHKCRGGKGKMPLYDCLLLLKSRVDRGHLKDLVAKVGRHVYTRNGVLTDVKAFGTVQLGYGIQKLDGRHYQGQLMQMSMMVPPNFPKELHYLNKEDRLLRWLVVKHRGVKYGINFLSEEEGKSVLWVPNGSLTARDNDEGDNEEYDDQQ